jgi:hypothetical protein
MGLRGEVNDSKRIPKHYLANVGWEILNGYSFKAKQMESAVTKRYFGSVLVLGILLSVVSANAQGSKTRAGVLTCRTSASIGLIVGSHQKLRCQFKADAGWTQNYTGVINRVGMDLGVTAGGIMTWLVMAQTSAMPHEALTGRFVGASGDISAGVGVGANVLVGGTRKSISLQPLSVEGQVGVNLALGVAAMTLQPVR